VNSRLAKCLLVKRRQYKKTFDHISTPPLIATKLKRPTQAHHYESNTLI